MRLMISAAVAALLSGCATQPAATLATAPALQPLPASVTSELPRNARPWHYAIEIVPDAQAMAFSGRAAIDLELFEPSRSITLNAIKLDLARAMLTPAAGGAAVPLTIALDADREIATFTAPETLAPGRYRLAIDYSGPIGTQASGFFALDYPDKRTGKTVRGLFTQFETPDAREFAPLFDEPSYKATFDLTAVVPEGQMAVSNMPVAGEESLGDGRKRVRFATTPPMSSYLLFFAAGEFERLAKDAGDGVEVGIVAPAGSGETARYALDSLAPLIPFYNDYFGVKYPLPKLDNVAGPGSSQQFGAMENWGAIFTFEGSLLLDPRLTTPTRQQYLYSAQAHEVAHQWFGDLVTMAWWDDLWLNEGFASWMESKATAHFKPDWYADVARVNGRERAMAADSIASTHPIVIHARTAQEADQNFDAISYSKGEAVITMLEAFAGEDTWRAALRRYMAEHKFGNAVTADLWRAAEEAGATGLTGVADSFTRQAGVPLVRATATCSGGRTSLALTTGQYSRDRRDEVARDPQHWLIPMTVRAADGSLHRQLLDGPATFDLPGCGPVIVNGGQMGYFRTLYTPEMLDTLAAGIAGFAPTDQLGLFRDNLALAEAGYQGYGPALDLLAAIPSDANPVVAQTAVTRWEDLYDAQVEPAQKAAIGRIASARWMPRLQAIGFDPRPGESLAVTDLRADLISALGTMGDPAVAAEASRRLELLRGDATALDGPLKQTWLSIIARNADAAEWQLLRTLASAAKTSVERDAYFAMLGGTQDPTLARKALQLALTSEVSATNGAQIISRVASLNPDLAFDFAVANRAAVEALVDDSSRPAYLAELAATSKDPAMVGKLEALRDTMREDLRLPADRALARLRQRLASQQRQQGEVAAWLATRD